MDAVLVAVKDLFTLNMLIIALSGTVLGMVWGAMPALSTTMAMALLVGLTIKMSTYEAIMFLMSIMTSSVFGGSITAVLINIPGTPASIPTAIEGYPLTQKGEGGLALGTAIVASFFGNWIGIIAVIIFHPPDHGHRPEIRRLGSCFCSPSGESSSAERWWAAKSRSRAGSRAGSDY